MFQMKSSQLFFSFLSYVIGAATGLFLILTVTWADMEAASYGFSRLADPGLDGFNCPTWMTREETSRIALNISNTTDGPIRPAVRTMISTPIIHKESVENVLLAPGESKKLEWEVGAGNIDLKHFIFAKAVVYAAYPLPSRETTCGIYIIDLPGRGGVILPVLIGLSLLGLGWGLYGIRKWGHPKGWLSKNNRFLTFLAVLVGLGFVASLMSGWLPGVIVLVLVLLVITIQIGSYSMSEQGRAS
jgi:hypothetical protein